MPHSPVPVISAPEPNAGNIPGLRLGEILVARGVITRPQLNSALEEQLRQGGRLGPIIVSLGYASFQDIERYTHWPLPSKLGQRLI